MSLITRCAHCHTVFRITPEQLQAHGGQVRCGRCMQVFDGRAALAPDTAMTAPPEFAEPATASAVPATGVPEPAVPAPAAGTSAQPAAGPEPVSVTETPVESAATVPAAVEHGQLLDILPEPPPAPLVAANVAAERPAVAGMDDDNPLVQEPTEQEPAQRRRPLLAAASVLLVVALGAQAVFFYRGEIAARHPLARQWLNEICAQAGCVVLLPQRPKAVVIEASDLQVVDPARPNRIQLTATLRNHAGHDVAYPALDLVLTNVNDHTLARRIFLPHEYLGEGRDPRAGVAANAELTVRLALETGNLGAAGFRLAVLPAPLR
jgi:predicted Zn finger-like uncharacterized protein